VRSHIRKRSVEINGTPSAVSLEDEFYAALCKIAEQRHVTVQDLIGYVANHKTQKNLSSELRLTVLRELQNRLGYLNQFGHR
jgi:predicted DNA-binding ribbon-helix-helix protein